MELFVIYLFCTFMGFSIISFLSIQYNQCIYDAEEEMLLSIRRDKKNAQKEAELRSQEPEPEPEPEQETEEPQEQKEEEIAMENPNNQSHDPFLLNTGTPPSSSKRVKTSLSFKQKWNWEFDGIVTEKSIDSKHQSINITTDQKNPKTKSRWSNLKSKAKSIIRKYVPLMSPTKDKL